MVALDAFLMLIDPLTLLVMLACAVYGLTVGAIPGFTATMAVALLMPVTYFLDPVPALAGIVALAAMAICSSGCRALPPPPPTPTRPTA